MDLAMMLSGEKRDGPSSDSPTPKRARPEPTISNPSSSPQQKQQQSHHQQHQHQQQQQPAPASSARRDSPTPPQQQQQQQQSPYSDLQRAVHNALENKTEALTTSEKVALALEVLRARQLELDLAQARNNIEALVTKTGNAPRTLRAVIPASTVKGLPVGTPIDISTGKFLLSPTTNDPQALFLTLELQSFGNVVQSPKHESRFPEQDLNDSAAVHVTHTQSRSHASSAKDDPAPEGVSEANVLHHKHQSDDPKPL